MTTTTIDENKLNQFMGRAVGDVGAAMSAALVLIGDELGLYKAMAAAGAVTPGELAKRTETTSATCASGSTPRPPAATSPTTPASGRYTLPPEQAVALADETSPAFVPGAFQVIAAAMWAAPRIDRGFPHRRGARLGRAGSLPVRGHRALLPLRLHRQPGRAPWIPALDGVEAKLERGARVADVGCGLGASTILMAQAVPQVEFVGFDSHAGLDRDGASGAPGTRASATASASRWPATRLPRNRLRPGGPLRLPARHGGSGRAPRRHIRQTLAKDGTWLMVEPFASDTVGGQPQPRRPRVLLGVDDVLRARARWRGTVRRWARRRARRACAR